MDAAALALYRRVCDHAAIRGDHVRLTAAGAGTPHGQPLLHRLSVHRADGIELAGVRVDSFGGLTGATRKLADAYGVLA